MNLVSHNSMLNEVLCFPLFILQNIRNENHGHPSPKAHPPTGIRSEIMVEAMTEQSFSLHFHCLSLHIKAVEHIFYLFTCIVNPNGMLGEQLVNHAQARDITELSDQLGAGHNVGQLYGRNDGYR